MINHNAKRIAAFAMEHRLPAVSMWRAFAEAGGLMTYGPNVGAMIRRTAAHVDKILKGAKPGDLPMEQPTTFQPASQDPLHRCAWKPTLSRGPNSLLPIRLPPPA
jgi:ABC-type uncharacterized transport system substrate-binding protein